IPSAPLPGEATERGPGVAECDTGPSWKVWNRSVLLATPVVLEDQAGGADDQGDGAADEHPPVPERRTVPDDGDREGDQNRPVAVGAEEAQLAGAVSGLGLLVVPGKGADAPRHEPEVTTDQQAQAGGEHEGRGAVPLDARPRRTREVRVPDTHDGQEDKQGVENSYCCVHRSGILRV